MNQTDHTRNSLELHLFFSRIMMEHAYLLEAGLPEKEKALKEVIEQYRNSFQNILEHVIRLSNGIVSPEIIASQELVTNYTHEIEEKTKELTGLPIDTNLTLLERNLTGSSNPNITEETITRTRQINHNTLHLLENFINDQKRILNSVLTCQLFNSNYPLQIDHVIEEAKLYLAYMKRLENNQSIERDKEGRRRFWNEIMMEHALFIRGLLDPSETDLINEASNYARRYQELMKEMKELGIDTEQLELKDEILTNEFRNFKQDGVKSILECKLRSIALPLLMDHVLREANHYLRILKESK